MRINSLHKPAELSHPAPEPASIPVTVRSVALIVIATASGIYLLQQMQSVLVPFVLGLLLFYALDPVVDWLQKIWIPRAIGAALALTLAVGSVGAVAFLLQDQAMTVVNQLPDGARSIG